MVATAANPFPNWQPAAGIDFSPGKMFGGKDVYKIASPSGYQAILKNGLESGAGTPVTAPPATSTNIYGTGSALPKSSDAVNYYLDIAKGLAPLQRQQAIDSAQLQQQINQQGFADAYPWVSQAGREGRAGSLAASKDYRAFAAGLPGPVQDIMASKQNQVLSAKSGEASLMMALAAQQDAATRFARSYA